MGVDRRHADIVGERPGTVGPEIHRLENWPERAGWLPKNRLDNHSFAQARQVNPRAHRDDFATGVGALDARKIERRTGPACIRDRRCE